MKNIAYLTNAYARASDSFIRAEVFQLRSFGHTVHTFSIVEPAASERVSDEIRKEYQQTDYILKHGLLLLLAAGATSLLTAPVKTLSTLALAARCGWPGLKGRLWPLAYFLEACYLSGQLRKKKIDHLHVHIGEGCAFVAMLASCLSGVPYSITIHGPGEFDHPTLLSLGEKIHRSRFTVAVSEYGRSQLYRWTASEDWPKIQVVHCGVRAEEMTLPPLPSDRRLVCIGRLSEQKGHLVLLEAIAYLKDEAPFEIVLVGDGPLRSLIETRAGSLGIQDRLRITGWLPADKVKQEILNSRAQVLASFAEGLPVVLMESLVMHRPAIATAIAGIPELIEPGISGWLVPAGAVEALASAMREALSADPRRLEQMGRAGAEKVKQNHDQTKEARKLEDLIGRT